MNCAIGGALEGGACRLVTPDDVTLHNGDESSGESGTAREVFICSVIHAPYSLGLKSAS